jgi:phosphoglycolate phosphatase
MNTKLVLFDIDGTLIHHVGPRKWEEQYQYGFKTAYGVDPSWDFSKYNGNVELQAAWDILKNHGMGREEFDKHYQEYIDAMHEHLDSESQGAGPLFRIIEPAHTLVKKLYGREDVVLGILTGNAKRIADWKLDHVGLSKYFTFGLYGDVADDRISLAKTVFDEAKSKLKKTFAPSDIVVIGDTIHDIRCGKAIGAITIAVTTGLHGFWDTLMAEEPDILVKSLMEPQVLQLFQIK